MTHQTHNALCTMKSKSPNPQEASGSARSILLASAAPGVLSGRHPDTRDNGSVAKELDRIAAIMESRSRIY